MARIAKPTVPTVILTVDVMNLLYRVFHAVPHMSRRDGFPTNAIYGFVRSIWKIQDQEKADKVILCFDSPRRKAGYDARTRQVLERCLLPTRHDPFYLMRHVSLFTDAMTVPGDLRQDIVSTLLSRKDPGAGVAECVQVVMGDTDVYVLWNVLPLSGTALTRRTSAAASKIRLSSSTTDRNGVLSQPGTSEKVDTVGAIAGSVMVDSPETAAGPPVVIARRSTLYSSYKGTRSALPDAMKAQIPFIKIVCEAMGCEIVEEDGAEADDVIGSIAAAKGPNEQIVMVTADKDLAQCVKPGVVMMRPSKKHASGWDHLDTAGVKRVYGVLPRQIPDYLALMGDTSDNIEGLDNVGAKTAAKLLDEFDSAEGVIANASKVRPLRVRDEVTNNVDKIRLNLSLTRLTIFPVAKQRPPRPRVDELCRIFEELELGPRMVEAARRRYDPDSPPGDDATTPDVDSMLPAPDTISSPSAPSMDVAGVVTIPAPAPPKKPRAKAAPVTGGADGIIVKKKKASKRDSTT